MAEDKLRIHQDAVVCREASLKGNVTVGAGTVVHPGAKIHALAGPIVLGSNNLVEEGVQIVTRENENGSGQVLHIGNYNTFQVGCRVYAALVGDGNVVEAKAELGDQCVVESGAVVGSTLRVPPKSIVPEDTVLYGAGGSRVMEGGAERNTHDLEPRLDQLRKILPQTHKLHSR